MKNQIGIYLHDDEIQEVSTDIIELLDNMWADFLNDGGYDLEKYMKDYSLKNEEEAWQMFCDDGGCEEYGYKLLIFEQVGPGSRYEKANF